MLRKMMGHVWSRAKGLNPSDVTLKECVYPCGCAELGGWA